MSGERLESAENQGYQQNAGALTSRRLEEEGFVHAFFTRRGGVSGPPWDTLNLAASTGDDPAAVRENLARVARRLGVPPARVYFLSQVHGVAARILRGDEDREAVLHEVGDITLSCAPGVACGVRSADCVPVLIADRRSGAVAAVHSGWRGTAQRVVQAGVEALLGLAGTGVELVAAIGPHIEACCFEVGEDVAAELARCSPLGDAAAIRQEGARQSTSGAARGQAALRPRPRVDLRRVIRAQLEEAGVASADIDDVRGCSVCDAASFFSYRRDGQRSGRLLSAIVARGAAQGPAR